MRIVLACLVLALMSSPALAQQSVSVKKVKTVPEDNRLPGHEPDTYRFGIAYNTMRGTTPGQCEQMCNRDDSCAAWSLVPATFQMGPRCELKRNIGSQSYRPGAVSGIALKYLPTNAKRSPRTVPTRQVSTPQRAITPAQIPSQQRLQRAPVTRAPSPSTRVAVPTMRSSDPVIVRPSAPVSNLMGGPRVSSPTVQSPSPMIRPAPAPRAQPAPQVLSPPAQNPVPVREGTRPPGPPPPSRPVPQFSMDPNQPAPDAITGPTVRIETPITSTGGVQIDPPAPLPQRRRPNWTEPGFGDGNDYSVRDSDFIPGDEEATAGLVEGVPEDDGEE
ncbi:MAG: PAN domain-containing protein [Pseudomonadota bacterium]